MASSSSLLELPERALRVEQAYQRHPRLAPRLLPALTRSDALADQVAVELGDDPQGTLWRELTQALGGRRPTTSSVKALLEQATDRPSWIDEATLKTGGRALVRRGPIGGMLLGAALVVGYASPAGNKPLVLSGVLHKRLVRRVNETARFVEAVTKPGGMRPGADGFGITMRVRVMHARVRQLCLQSGRWDAPAWGHPINQHDMLATILLFSSVVLLGFERFGIPARGAEEEHYLRLWSYVGHVIGVEPALLPIDRALADEVQALIDLTQGPPDEDSRNLTHAFLEAPLQEAKTEQERRRAAHRVAFSHGMLRSLLPPEMADGLGLRRNSYRFVVPTAARAFRSGRLLRRAPGAGRVAERLGRRYWDGMLEVALAGRQPSFAPPERLYG